MSEEDPISQGPLDKLAYRVAYLIAGYLGKTLTPSENQELDEWVCANMDNQRLFEELTDPKNINAWLAWKEKLLTAQVLERLKSKLEFTPEPAIAKTKTKTLWKFGAAAAILLAIIASVELFQNRNHSNSINSVSVLVKDIAPGESRAILTLSNGKIINLDNVGKGSIGSDGNVNISKEGSGLLTYKIADPAIFPSKEEYNTLSVPPGGQYRVQLPDGTNVWLNSSSSIKYPTIFHGPTRSVELTGEGYFEVAKDPMFPFVVKTGIDSVQVLGTHFNINAYADEPTINVTLAEGSVRVNGSVVLVPGQQAQIDQKTEIKTVQGDLATVLAWKDGLFLFKQTPLKEMMRQVARWYDASISYEANITDHFNADIPRSVPVSKLLHLLESTDQVHFRIEGKKIIVMK